jgi:hypothetical protein
VRAVIATVVVAIGVGALAGCTPPAVVPDPEVVWESQGTSPLEDDAAVVAARAADLARALAFNTLDFARDDFTTTHTAAYAAKIYDAFETTYVDIEAEPRALPGPSIWMPLSVEEGDDGTIAVVVCDASDHWIIETGVEPSYDLTDAFELTVLLERDGDRLVVADKQVSLNECDATGAPIGRFDPTPVPPSEITSVVAPRKP